MGNAAHAQAVARVRQLCRRPSINGLKGQSNTMRSRFLVFGAIMLVACSSASAKKDAPTTTDTPPSDTTPPNQDPVNQDPMTDGGSGSDTSTPVVDSGPHAPTNQAECIAACEAAHPTAAALSHKLDATCYLAGTCEPVCNNIPPGKLYPSDDPDAAAPVACPAQHGEGVDPIMTPSAACSSCLANTPACCTLWVSIFGTVDGRDLNKCAVTCFSTFKN